MGYDATPETANLIGEDEVRDFCEKHDGEMLAADCRIQGENGELWISATPGQTSRQNAIIYQNDDSYVVSGTNDADEVILDPSQEDLTGKSVSEFAPSVAGVYDVSVAIKEGNMMSTFGINYE